MRKPSIYGHCSAENESPNIEKFGSSETNNIYSVWN